jgi:hypothetical protein
MVMPERKRFGFTTVELAAARVIPGNVEIPTAKVPQAAINCRRVSVILAALLY